MTKFQVAFNEKSTVYQVHVAGCFHLKAAHMEVMAGEYEAETGKQVAVEFMAGNEGCLAALGPCAKKAA